MSKSEQRRFQEQMMRVKLNRQKNKENKEMFGNALKFCYGSYMINLDLEISD
jgi:hypothetical protein